MRPDAIILGGGCGATPDHVRDAAGEVAPLGPHALTELAVAPRLSAPVSCEVTS